MTPRLESRRFPSFVAWFLAAITLVARLDAQELVVSVRSGDPPRPAVGALVSLVGADGGTLVAAVTNELGRARLRGRPGSFTLRLRQPGRVDTSLAVTLGPGADSVVIAAPSERPSFPAALLDPPARCAAGGVPADLEPAWDEARKTLAVVAAGEDLGVATLSIAAFERELSTSLKPESRQLNTLLGAANRPPNVNPDAERTGYVARSDSLVWSAPDVNRFRSAEFERGHCFGWVSGTGEREGMAGLRFEPVEGAAVGLTGTMWFDLPARELRVIDYRFARAPESWRPERFGGSLEVHRSAIGFWITRFWYQRTPKVRLAERSDKDRLTGFHEIGAEVTAVEAAIDTTDPAAVAQAFRRQAAAARGRFARVIATVVDSLGSPVVDAEVGFVGTELETKTTATGQFVMGGLPTGWQIARVRKIGYKVRFLPIHLAAGQDWEGKIVVAKLPVILGDIVVVGKYGKPAKYANTAKYDDFYRRRAAKVGRFLTRDEIDKQNSNRIADLIRAIPGVRTTFNPVGGNDAVEFQGCPPDNVGVWVDGQRLTGAVGELLPLITARDVEAVEVYPRESQIPPQFQDGTCAAIVLWTR